MRTEIGPEISGAVSDFLRECDQRKFAPIPPPAPLGAVSEAERLIGRAEARRAKLAEAAEGRGRFVAEAELNPIASGDKTSPRPS